MTTLRTKAAVTTLAAFSLVGTLAGCSTASTSDSSSASAASGSSAGASAATTSSTYKDGTYTATGTYQSPGGSETTDVSITLAGGVVTAVKATSDGTDPDEVHYQGAFSSGISAAVVGKKIDELNVDKVGGSSLTSQGFNTALAKIKTEAKA